MFIKKIDKSSNKTGKSYYTYRLCESYRIENKVRHRNILNIGKLENIRKEDFKLLCDRIEQKIKGINPLFSMVSDSVEKEAEFIYRRILNEKLLDCRIDNDFSSVVNDNSENPDIRKVDINTIINEDSRSFGGEWLSYQMFEDCGLFKFLSEHIGNEEIEKLIATEIISRMIHPSSELETSRWIKNESSLCEILSLRNIEQAKIYSALNFKQTNLKMKKKAVVPHK